MPTLILSGDADPITPPAFAREAAAWFLARWPDGSFDLHRVAAPFARPPVAVRTIVASPFPGEAGTIYLGGFDANMAPAHDTAWVVRSALVDALGTAP